MNILSFGTDSSVLNPTSPLAQRVRDYGSMVDKYDVVVTNTESKTVKLSEKITIYGVDSKNKIFGLIRFFLVSYNLLKKDKYNIITVQDQYFIAFLGLLLCRWFGIGLHLQIHGWEKFGGVRAKIAQYVLVRANEVRTVSGRLKKQLVDDFGVQEKNITVVPMHVKVSMTAQRKQDDKDENNKFVFLTVGRLVPVKNIEMQINAVKELVGNNKNIELLIVGDGPGRNGLESMISKLGLNDFIKLLGRKNKEELEMIYNQSDIFMLTSFAEGWPLVIIEAANFGLPIIMTDVGSAGEFINNENGIIVPVDDGTKLVVAMQELINNKELRNKISANVYNSAINLPSYEEILKLYKESWQKAVLKNNINI